jgi:TetR/AcrR family transcriptional regulator, mexJK operon transcriptional repressor
MTCQMDEPAIPFAASDIGPQDRCSLNARMPGRPKDMEKREAIVDAAQILFSTRGVEGVSIEAIAAASGVSKVTVYNNFGDKAAIFRAMIQRETDRLGRLIADTMSHGGALEDRLTQFGGALMRMLGEPCHLALDRTMSIEAQRNPEIGRQFFEAGPGRTLEMLIGLLDEAVAQGEIKLDDTHLAAQDLVSLWFGFRMMARKYLPMQAPMDPAELTKHVAHGTSLFLRAYGAK